MLTLCENSLISVLAEWCRSSRYIRGFKLKCTASKQHQDLVILFSTSDGVFTVVQRTGNTECSFTVHCILLQWFDAALGPLIRFVVLCSGWLLLIFWKVFLSLSWRWS